jgi:hypothetical protein
MDIDRQPALIYIRGLWVILNCHEEPIIYGEAQELFWLLGMHRAIVAIARHRLKRPWTLKKLKNTEGAVA